MVVVSIASLKVTVREMFGATDEAESAGEDEETVGVVVSSSVDVVEEPLSLLLLQEIMVRLKEKIRKMNKTFFIFSSIPKVKHFCLFHENTKHNINRFVLQESGDFGGCLTVKN